MPEKRRRSGADQVSARAFLDPNNERYLGSEQEIVIAVNDNLGL
jgi:hypothetical protein